MVYGHREQTFVKCTVLQDHTHDSAAAGAVAPSWQLVAVVLRDL